MCTTQLMHSLIINLLDLAQRESEIPAENASCFDLNKVLEECQHAVQPYIKLKHVRLQTSIKEPHFFENIFGNERRYLMVLTSFLAHAINLSPSRSVIGLKLKAAEARVKKRRSGLVGSKDNSADIYTDQTAFLSFEVCIQNIGSGMSLESFNELLMSFSTLEESDEFDRNAVGICVCKNIVE